MDEGGTAFERGNAGVSEWLKSRSWSAGKCPNQAIQGAGDDAHHIWKGNGGVGGLRGRHVLGPLIALERTTGTIRLCVVVARSGVTGEFSPLRCGQCSGTTISPGYNPQAAATLCQMFPGRFWMALGTGEALNELITGERWPPKAVRNARLIECVDVMRALFAGETVSHDGLVKVDRAKLWTLPDEHPRLIGAAVVMGFLHADGPDCIHSTALSVHWTRL